MIKEVINRIDKIRTEIKEKNKEKKQEELKANLNKRAERLKATRR